jgi:hypothetical protein
MDLIVLDFLFSEHNSCKLSEYNPSLLQILHSKNRNRAII